MSESYTVGSMKELLALLKKHSSQREKKVHAASARAAVKGRAFLKRNVPVAFGEIRESVHTEGETIVVDAPHAAPVNNGSRPHWVPIGPLIAWVKQRGMQGLLSARQISRLPGTSTGASAHGVAAMLRQHESGGASPIDAAEQVARAIQRAIAAHGTKPHHFIEKTLPELRALLGEELRSAMEGDPSTGGDAPSGGGPSGGASKPSASGWYRKSKDTYRGSPIRTDAKGARSVTLKNGKTIRLQH